MRCLPTISWILFLIPLFLLSCEDGKTKRVDADESASDEVVVVDDAMTPDEAVDTPQGNTDDPALPDNDSTGPSCGNGIVETGEACDSNAMNCADLDPSYTGGVAECMADCTWDASLCVEETNDEDVITACDAAIFSPGNIPVSTINIKEGDGGAPKAMIIYAPNDQETHPVVFLFHGFLCSSTWFENILFHLATHGFIAVAPQMYKADGLPIGKPKAAEEATDGIAVVQWAETALDAAVPGTPDFTKVGFAGHSRGGKVIWLMIQQIPQYFSAIAGIDPVDGTGGPFGGEAEALPGPITYTAPSLVLGTGRGPTGTSACAPADDGYAHFYANIPTPAWQIVATDFGHMEMIDTDDVSACGTTCSLCAKSDGLHREEFQQTVRGSLAAFFKNALLGDNAFMPCLTDAAAMPVAVTMQNK
ncbi:MAG TPA: dienelactone hydrolase family protein [bacterium]|nr:dienelactone hydrolase family protein [bacterium]